MNYALIVAAGKGVRMKSPKAKQYMPLAGIPILSRTLLAFDRCPVIDALFLTVSPEEQQYCQREIVDPLNLSTALTIVSGGESRQESVYNGLEAMDAGDHWVGIHDGVRPFIAPELIEACFKTAQTKGSCILGLPVVETLKEVDDEAIIRQTRDRSDIWLAQTPQVFRLIDIRKAHADARQKAYLATDDAALMERIGLPVAVLPGSRYNIKITTNDDLLMAEAIVQAGLLKDMIYPNIRVPS